MRGAAGTMRGGGPVRDAGDVSGAGLQPLVCEMLRADRSAGRSFGSERRASSTGVRSSGRIVRLAGQRSVGSFDKWQKSVRSERSAG